jgi:hypothetical protein
VSERDEFEAWNREEAFPFAEMYDQFRWEIWHAAWQAAHATAEPTAVPEGWKLVPIEPTEEMLNVYHGYHRSGKGYLDLSIWRDMIAAAPHPLPVQEKGANQKYQD